MNIRVNFCGGIADNSWFILIILINYHCSQNFFSKCHPRSKLPVEFIQKIICFEYQLIWAVSNDFHAKSGYYFEPKNVKVFFSGLVCVCVKMRKNPKSTLLNQHNALYYLIRAQEKVIFVRLFFFLFARLALKRTRMRRLRNFKVLHKRHTWSEIERERGRILRRRCSNDYKIMSTLRILKVGQRIKVRFHHENEAEKKMKITWNGRKSGAQKVSDKHKKVALNAKTTTNRNEYSCHIRIKIR